MCKRETDRQGEYLWRGRAQLLHMHVFKWATTDKLATGLCVEGEHRDCERRESDGDGVENGKHGFKHLCVQDG